MHLVYSLWISPIMHGVLEDDLCRLQIKLQKKEDQWCSYIHKDYEVFTAEKKDLKYPWTHKQKRLLKHVTGNKRSVKYSVKRNQKMQQIIA